MQKVGDSGRQDDTPRLVIPAQGNDGRYPRAPPKEKTTLPETHQITTIRCCCRNLLKIVVHCSER